MEFRNHTWFPAQAFLGATQGGETFHVVALRQTLAFADGSLAYAEEQTPLCDGDRFTAEPRKSSLAAESDFCPFKPRCDVLLNATAHAPRGLPARTFRVGLRIQAPGGENLLDKSLLISGPARFRRRFFLFRFLWFLGKVGTLGILRRNPWKRTRSGKILRLPVRYEFAFGGEAKVLITDRGASRVRKKAWLAGVTPKALKEAHKRTGARGPLAWEVFDGNPLGRGFAPAWFLRVIRPRTVPAPQIEAPGAQVTARHFHQGLRGRNLDDPAFIPQGLGLLAKAWRPRSGLLGKVEAQRGDGPAPLPVDFDFGYWNGASPDQQLPYLQGDETLTLTNLCAATTPGARVDGNGDTLLKLQLPGHLPHLLVRYGSGEVSPAVLNLDTLHLDPEQRTLVLVWRGILPLEPGVRVLEARLVAREDKNVWLRQGGFTWAGQREREASPHG